MLTGPLRLKHQVMESAAVDTKKIYVTLVFSALLSAFIDRFFEPLGP